MFPTNSPHEQQYPSAEFNFKRILVVDDNQTILGAIKGILEAECFIVDTADSVASAKQILSSHRPDLVVCDVMMPSEDGFSFFRAMRDNPDLQEIPFVFLTAMAEAEEVRVARELGVDDYMTKPFVPEDLVSVVKGKLKRNEQHKHVLDRRIEDFRKRVIHTLSHEFRTPLVAVNTGTEILKEQYKKLDENVLADLLDSVQRGGMRLQRLVEDFITLQQIDSGHANVAHKRFARVVDLAEIMATAIQIFKEDFNAKEHLEIKITPPKAGEQFLFSAYEMQVNNVLLRILSNAKKFGGKGNPIEVSFSSSDEAVSVSIRDYGNGMPETVVNDACGLFVQINRDVLEQQGCGLGLAIACSFLKINSGSIEFKNPETGSGTVVKISFPRQK